MYFTALSTETGPRRRHEGVGLLARCRADPRVRASSGSTRPDGVTIQDFPSTRRAAPAQPAVLTQAATGPCSPAVVAGRTKTAPFTCRGYRRLRSALDAAAPCALAHQGPRPGRCRAAA